MKPGSLTRESVKSQTAIVVLAYADYESLELALASHAKFTVNSGLPIYILQNGRVRSENDIRASSLRR